MLAPLRGACRDAAGGVGDTNLNEHLVRQGLLTGTGELAASPPRAPAVPPLAERSAADIAWIGLWTFGWIVAGVAGAWGLSSFILRRPSGAVIALLVLTAAFYQLGNSEGYDLIGPLVAVLFVAFFGRKLAVLRLLSEEEFGGGAAG
jgi:hypothetical protein